MKKLSTLLIAFSVTTFALFAETSGCNNNTPGWGDNLGVISTATNQIWRVQGPAVTQIWSDAVTATGCNKNFFFGGPNTPGEFNADCRSNPNQRGDLFSWCAIYRFGHLLCPYPWRVPTAEDFIVLDRILGGTGEFRTDRNFVRRAYLAPAIWGGTLSGGTGIEGVLTGQTQNVRYWSSTEVGTGAARALYFNALGQVYPQRSFNKNEGFSLRCIR
ncbi:MAG: fibrobacter succinogenes major paralogous domain-containing protein [Bacteroidales bacterium]|nr:fibrobacter succinogenes major paralogous domain-containing protein [Bacteroidales bacterium]